MDLAVWQIILLVILAACTILDALTLVIGLNFPVITGTLAGIIMGDMVLGLAIGATLQLMVLVLVHTAEHRFLTLQREQSSAQYLPFYQVKMRNLRLDLQFQWDF